MLSGPPVTGTLAPDQLLDRFLAAPPRQRRSLLRQIDQRVEDLIPLIPDRLDALLLVSQAIERLQVVYNSLDEALQASVTFSRGTGKGRDRGSVADRLHFFAV